MTLCFRKTGAAVGIIAALLGIGAYAASTPVLFVFAALMAVVSTALLTAEGKEP